MCVETSPETLERGRTLGGVSGWRGEKSRTLNSKIAVPANVRGISVPVIRSNHRSHQDMASRREQIGAVTSVGVLPGHYGIFDMYCSSTRPLTDISEMCGVSETWR